MRARKLIAVAAVLCGAVAVVWFALSGERAPALLASNVDERAAERTASALQPGSAVEMPASEPSGSPRTPIDSTAPTEPPPTPATGPIHGRVVDTLAVPVSGVVVVLDASSPDKSASAVTATSDANGRFVIDAGERTGRLRAGAGPWISVFEQRVPVPDARAEPLVVVAPFQSVDGRVVDAAGSPIAEADVRVELASAWGVPRRRQRPTPFEDRDIFWFFPDSELRTTFPLDLDGCDTAEWSTKTDVQGRFSMVRVPRLRSARVNTEHDGYEPDSRDLPREGEALTIVLHPPAPQLNRVIGHVVDRERRPVDGAWVLLGSDRTTSARDGRFELDLGGRPKDEYEGRPLVAVKEGFLPVSQPCLASSPLDAGAWPSPLELVLDEKALAIRGRVVGADGKPARDVRVHTRDPVGLDEVLLAAGSPAARAGAGYGVVLGGSDTTSDENGNFVLRGLLPRTFRLRAVDPVTLRTGETPAIPAGTSDVEIRVASPVHACIAGRVVYVDGGPVANARVQGCRTEGSNKECAQETRTDADGRFRIETLARDAELLNVQADGANGRDWRIADQRDPCDVLLVLPRNGDVRVEIGTSGITADRFAVFDAAGERVIMTKHFGNGAQGPFPSLEIEDGKSDWAMVSEDAVTLVLYAGDREVTRIPLHVRHGELNVVRP